MNKNMVGLASLAMIAMQKRNKGGFSRKRSKPMNFMYDSQYNLYRVSYDLMTVYETPMDSTSSLMASNLRNFEKNPYFLDEFQARDLGSMKERLKIQSMLSNFDPLLMCIPAALPLVGAPVVWTNGNHLTHCTYALAGNSRTVAFMNLSDSQYQKYIQMVGRFYPVFADKMKNPIISVDVPSVDSRLMLVRRVYNAQGEPLTLAQAKVLAANSQGSPAGEQSYLGRLISKARGLSLERGQSVTSAYNLKIQKPMPLSLRTLDQFMKSNPGFGAELTRVMDAKSRRQADTSQQSLYEMVVATMLYLFVPDSIIRSGFVSQKEEQALIAILPYLGALHQRQTGSGLIQYWDLLPYLDTAREFALMTSNLAYEDALRAYESMCDENQTTMVFQGMTEQEVRPQICSLPLLAVVLGLYLKRASGLADPTSTAHLFGPYFDDAIESSNALFMNPPEVEKEKALDSLMSAVLPKRLATKVNKRLR